MLFYICIKEVKLSLVRKDMDVNKLLPGTGLAFKDRVGNVPELCALYVHGQFTLKV